MKLLNTLGLLAALLASAGAQAKVGGGTGKIPGSSSAGLAGVSMATLTGGAIYAPRYSSDLLASSRPMTVPFAAMDGASLTRPSANNTPDVDPFATSDSSPAPVPEPKTYALMFAGLGAMGLMMRRRSLRE